MYDTALCCVPAAKFACAPSSIYGAWMKLKLARTVSLFGCHTAYSLPTYVQCVSNIVAAKEAAPNLTHTTIVQFSHTHTHEILHLTLYAMLLLLVLMGVIHNTTFWESPKFYSRAHTKYTHTTYIPLYMDSVYMREPKLAKHRWRRRTSADYTSEYARHAVRNSLCDAHTLTVLLIYIY